MVMAPWPKEFAIRRSDNGSIQKGQFELIHMPGKEIPADKLTKLGNVSEHKQYEWFICKKFVDAAAGMLVAAAEEGKLNDG